MSGEKMFTFKIFKRVSRYIITFVSIEINLTIKKYNFEFFIASKIKLKLLKK